MVSVNEVVQEWLQLVKHAVDNIQPVLERKDMNDFAQEIQGSFSLFPISQQCPLNGIKR